MRFSNSTVIIEVFRNGHDQQFDMDCCSQSLSEALVGSFD